jgi:flagellar basal body-associated protein FliL
MPERRSRTLLWILIGGGAFFLFVLAVFSLVYLTLHAGSSEAASAASATASAWSISTA